MIGEIDGFQMDNFLSNESNDFRIVYDDKHFELKEVRKETCCTGSCLLMNNQINKEFDQLLNDLLTLCCGCCLGCAGLGVGPLGLDCCGVGPPIGADGLGPVIC